MCDAYLAKVGNQVSKKFLPDMCQAKSGLLKEEPMHNFEGWSKADTIVLGSLLVKWGDRKMPGTPTCPYSAVLSSNFYLLLISLWSD